METKTYWERQPSDQPGLLNGFNGTWKFSDHSPPQRTGNLLCPSFKKSSVRQRHGSLKSKNRSRRKYR